MKRLFLLLLMAPGLWADTLVSGSMSYQAGVTPFNTDTSFDLQLSGGPITTFDVFHFFQAGAKGGFSTDYTQGSFSFTPVPAFAIGVIGVSTDYTVVVNGVSYSQGAGVVVPDPTNEFSVNYVLTRISGTNVVDTTHDSTATGLFEISGTVSAYVNGMTYSDPFSADATFNGYYSTVLTIDQRVPVLSETYTFSPVPEPGTMWTLVAGFGVLASALAIQSLESRRKIR